VPLTEAFDVLPLPPSGANLDPRDPFVAEPLVDGFDALSLLPKGENPPVPGGEVNDSAPFVGGVALVSP